MLALASEAQGIADTTGDVFAEVLARQTIADAYCWNGRTAEGLAQQEIALELAAATQSVPTINHIYGLSIYNYMLDRKARRTEPLRVTEQWQALVRLDVAAWTSIATDWLPWVYLQAGDFGRADEVVAWMGHRTMEGYNRTIFQNARASVSWMRGNLHEAAEDIDHLRSRGVSKRWAHSFYPLAAEVAADLARLDEVREVTDAYLAMTLHPTREAAKLGVLYPLVRAEVDAAVDTGSGEHVERAHDALALMRRILHESPPLVDGWTSVMTHTQNLTFAEAETTRLGSPDPKRWAEAANHADYAYYRLYARWRMAQALLQSGDRSSSGSAALREAYVDADRTGARLLCDRMEHTAREHNLLLG
jgi:hypothetical protein